MRRESAISLGAIALWTCGAVFSSPVPATTIDEAIQRLDTSLTGVQHLTHADLLSEEGGARYSQARRFVHNKQCDSGTANPLVLTSLPIKANLEGTLGDNGNISISGVMLDGVERPMTSSSGRLVEIPLRISTLADLPQEYLREMASLIETKGLPAEVANKLKNEVPQHYARLTTRVQMLMNDFDPRFCPRSVGRGAQTERYRNIIFVPPTF